MGEKTGIAWCDHTFNPVIGCSAVSPGCDNCYAEAYAKRYGRDFAQRTKTKTWRDPLKWNKAAKAAGVRRRVFCASLADVFDAKWPAGLRDELWTLIAECDSLDFLLLTKRPENFATMLPWSPKYAGPDGQRTSRAWSNVWLGVTVENQEQANRRIPLLLAQDAVVRFLSCEPLLEAVDLDFGPFNRIGLLWKTCPTCNGSMSVPVDGGGKACPTCFDHQGLVNSGIDWAIIGGESGPKARPFDLAWARSLVRQCRDAGVAPFVKQMGDNAFDSSLTASGRDETIRCRAHHGADPTEWPEDLRVQEFPVRR